MFKKRLCIIFIGCAFFSILAAAEPIKVVLTVDQAVEAAKKNSRMLKTAAIDLEIKKIARDNVWGYLFPTVNANGAVSRSNTVTTIPGFPAPKPTEDDHWAAAGTISANLALNGMLVNSIRAAYASYEAGLISWEQTLKENERDVRKMFYSILFMYENLTLQKNLLENARQRWVQAQVNFRNGLVPELTVLQTQVSYEAKKPLILEIEQTITKQLSLFAFLLGYPYSTQIELEGKINPIYYELDANTLIAQYSSKNLSVLAVKKNIDVLKLQLSASKAGTYIPTLSVGYSFMPAISPMSKNWTTENNWSDRGNFNASLSWNLSNMLPFSQNMVNIRSTEKNLNKLMLTLDTIFETTELEINTLVNIMQKSRSSIEVQKLNVTFAQKAYALTVEAFNAGIRELLEVRDAESQLNQTYVGILQEQLNYTVSLLDLEYALNSKFGLEK